MPATMLLLPQRLSLVATQPVFDMLIVDEDGRSTRGTWSKRRSLRSSSASTARAVDSPPVVDLDDSWEGERGRDVSLREHRHAQITDDQRYITLHWHLYPILLRESGQSAGELALEDFEVAEIQELPDL